MLAKNLSMIVLVGGLVFGAWLFWSSSNDQLSAERDYESAAPAALAQSGPVIPELSGEAARGRVAFNQNCAICHGRDATGGAGGPSLIHKIYEPSHHADITFHRAVQNGVRAHHWGFGDMPPQAGVTPTEVDQIIAFVRATQRANGIN